jgi:hypothetical protein
MRVAGITIASPDVILMRSPIRALLVALVAMLAVLLVVPSTAQAKSTKSTKRVVKHACKSGHAKTTAKPHRARKSSGAKHPWKKKARASSR